MRSRDYPRCSVGKVVSRQWVTWRDGCWRECAVASERRDSWQEGARGRGSLKAWVLGEGDPGGEGGLEVRRVLKSRDGCYGGGGRSWGWEFWGREEPNGSRSTAVPGRGKEGSEHVHQPGPGPQDPTQRGFLPAAGPAATAPVPAPLLNPEPAAPERRAARLPPRPRGRDRVAPPSRRAGGEGAGPSLQPEDPLPAPTTLPLLHPAVLQGWHSEQHPGLA